ncbi:AAA domain-containing protein [Brevibacillus formosus]|uniref:DEAD/DEAH box helicase n=1 Tax=Brevibacillus formosus TaxID=54913 RepID=UPI003F1C8E9F
MSSLQDRINLLSYWHKVESFIPHEIDKDNTGKPVTSEETLPWADGVVKLASDVEVIFHKLCIGVFYVSEANRTIDEYLGHGKEKSPNHSDVLSCFAECSYTPSGMYKPGSFKLSTMPWAMGKLVTGEVFSTQWMNEFEHYCRDITKRIEQIFQERCEFAQLVQVLQVLTEQSRWLPSSMKSENAGRSCEPLIQFTYTRKKKVEESTQEVSSIDIEETEAFTLKIDNKIVVQAEEQVQSKEAEEILNSFYLRDLEEVIEAVKMGKVGKALEEYLSYNKQRIRVDVGKNPSQLGKFHKIRNLKTGRWPMNKSLSLNLMQQTSVNLINEQLADQEGIFSVNGPPGTGKTTLLRDVIAAIITDRAEKLVSYQEPAHAFRNYLRLADEQKKKADGTYYTYHYYELDEALRRDGIVIASSNNGAVQNITGELPGLGAIKEYANDENARYFQEIAQFVLDDPEVWGIISAIMGNRANRARFVDRFWFGSGESRHPELQAAGMKQLLQDAPTEEQWSQAVKRYHQAKARVNELISQMERWHTELKAFSDEQRKLISVQASITELEERIHQKQREEAVCQSEIEQQASYIDSLREAYVLEKQKYGWWQKWMWWRAEIKQHKKELLRYQLKLQNCLMEKLSAEQILQALKREREETIQFLNRQRLQQQETEEKITELEKRLPEIPEKFRKNLPTDEYWNIESPYEWDSFQKGSPWVFDELADARTQLFLQSLDVHRAFVQSANKQIRNNLTLFFNYLKGQQSFSMVEPYLPTLWNTFFLVVPVVSTTFASFATMMKGLKQEEIGWLIVDEAGQAVPQAAVGGLWRARRAIIVGDPLQIEPVLTIPERMLQHFQKHYDIPDRIASQTCSAQFVADLANPIGTEIETKEGPTWIGCPLYVHRRCLEPMFTIANEIAYSGKMVFDTKQPDNNRFPLGDSRWIDVKGRTPLRHWIPEQGEVVKELVKKAFETIGPTNIVPSLYIISPFTEVVKELQRELKKCASELHGHASKHEYQKWVNSAIGTVHTFQGKQAETVIFCLGLDSSAVGAAKWASGKPNILNVAATRAMYRFIIVGDMKLWKDLSHFDVAYQMLRQNCSISL